MNDMEFTTPAEIIREDGGIELFLEKCTADEAQAGTVFHPAGEYDAKTLIRHAIVALEDQMGINEAWQFTSKLLQVFESVKHWERNARRGVTR